MNKIIFNTKVKLKQIKFLICFNNIKNTYKALDKFTQKLIKIIICVCVLQSGIVLAIDGAVFILLGLVAIMIGGAFCIAIAIKLNGGNINE